MIGDDTNIHDRLRDAVARLTGYRSSTMRTTVSSHVVTGPMTLVELSGLDKYARDVLGISGMRISALGAEVVLSALAASESHTVKSAPDKTTSWLGFATSFRKRGREDSTGDAPSKRQTIRNQSVLDGTVKDAVALAKRAASSNDQEISAAAWDAAAKIASSLVNIKGTNGEAVCQGTTLHVSKMSTGEKTPAVVVAARLCGGVAISLQEIISVGDKLDGCVRIVRENNSASSQSDLPCNDDGATQVSVGGSALAIEIAVPVSTNGKDSKGVGGEP